MKKRIPERTGQARRAGQALRLRSGQAMVEFLLGLIGVTVLVVMLAQISWISGGYYPDPKDRTNKITGQMHMIIDARNDMAEKLVNGSISSFNAEYLSGWDSGSDGYAYTEDDTSISGNSGGLLDAMDYGLNTYGTASGGGEGLQESIAPDGLGGFDDNGYLKFGGGSGGQMGEAFGIFRVSGRTTITNELAVQALVWGAESFTFEHELYMPQIDNLGAPSGVNF